jgi:hypothetical protein
MKKYAGMAVEIQAFFTSTLVGGEWSASPLERALVKH